MPDTPIYIPPSVLATPLDPDDRIRVDRSGKTMFTRVEEFASDPAFAGQYAPYSIGGRGAVCFTFDDGYASWADIVNACNPGQHVTFFVQSNRIDTAGGVTSAELTSFAAAGHELGAHGEDNTSFTSLTASQRDAQHVANAADILAAGGVTPTSFAYPQGSRSSATDIECLHRYRRIFSTGAPSPIYVRPNRPGQFLFGRFSWNFGGTTRQNGVLELIRLAAEQGVVVTIYAHDPGNGSGSFSGDPSLVQLKEAFDLCQSLGVPMLAVGEALPSAPYGLINGGFENGLDGWVVQNTAAYTVEVVTDAPADGFPGTKSLHAVTTGGTTMYVRQRIPVDPGIPFNVSFRYHTVSGAGVGFQVIEYGWDDTSLATTSSTAGTASSWTLSNRDLTLNAATVALEISFYNQGASEWYVDHVHAGPQAWGKFG